MRLIDRYLLRQMLGPTLLATGALTGVALLSQSLAGLDALSYANTMTIYAAPITDLSGLSSLAQVDVALEIRDCPNIQSLHGAEALHTVAGHLVITGNDSLSSLDGLDGLTAVTGNVVIHDNPTLPACAAENLAAAMSATCDCYANDAGAACN